eukprot:jgi/Mesvir1/26889/Mv20621-RA.1
MAAQLVCGKGLACMSAMALSPSSALPVPSRTRASLHATALTYLLPRMRRDKGACSFFGGKLRQQARHGAPNLLSAASRAFVTKAEQVDGTNSFTMTQPDDWHLHLRDGGGLSSVVPHTARVFARAGVMPNLTPPVKTCALAGAYRERILANVSPSLKFDPMMLVYLTDNTSPEEVVIAKRSKFILGFKLYPAGATTNSDAGVTSLKKVGPVLETMAELGVPLCVHGEVTDPAVDVFDRERVFIETVLTPLLDRLPNLRVVMEHITTRDAAMFVESAPPNVAATITPQHLLLNRNDILVGGLKPHHYCLPVLKREKHRLALLEAATSGNPKYFLGTDSAPHERATKESECGCAGCFTAHAAIELYAHAFEQVGALDKLEAFASFHGADFYGLPRNTTKITLSQSQGPWTVPYAYEYGGQGGLVVPLWAGRDLKWSATVNR